MRPGLVFAGGMLVLLGVATIATFSLLPATSHNTSEVVTLPQEYNAHGGGMALLAGSDTASGTLVVGWRASSPVNVTLYPAAGCRVAGLDCATGPAAESWSTAVVGNWSTTGHLTFPYLLVWQGAAVAGNLTASGTETTDVRVTPPLLTTLLIDGAGAALGVLGGVAVFLGLFLRGGVYDRPPAVVSRSAEDVDEILLDERDR